MGEIALRTKGEHQLIGYANRYLGKKEKVYGVCHYFWDLCRDCRVYAWDWREY